MKILVTAGPTREKIDPVRYISNRSSGKMGYALAQAAAVAGHEVVLVSGPVALAEPPGVKLIKVESASDMATEVKTAAEAADLIIMAAAVADYRPVAVADHKIKKTSDRMVIELEKTEDILASLGAAKRPGQLLVGFAAETEDVVNYAKGKLQRKNLDWIVANDVSRSDRGFDSDNNAVTMIAADGRVIELPLDDKKRLASEIMSHLLS